MQEISLTISIGSTVMAGVFFAFSSFIMTALTNISRAEGIRAMQRINVDVFCWSFLILFFSIPIACLGLSAYAFLHLSQPESAYYLTGSSVYLIGCFLVTAFGNVPLNNMLERVDSEADDADGEWRGFLRSWMRWNHVRAASCFVAGILFAGASFAH